MAAASRPPRAFSPWTATTTEERPATSSGWPVSSMAGRGSSGVEGTGNGASSEHHDPALPSDGVTRAVPARRSMQIGSMQMTRSFIRSALSSRCQPEDHDAPQRVTVPPPRDLTDRDFGLAIALKWRGDPRLPEAFYPAAGSDTASEARFLPCKQTETTVRRGFGRSYFPPLRCGRRLPDNSVALRGPRAVSVHKKSLA